MGETNTDLKALIAGEGALSPQRTVSVLSQVASALDAAHAEGLVHRDVKPANILLVPASDASRPDRVYLSDFGLTKRASSDSGLTATGQFVGTLDYAAPEQIKGEPLSPRTDVYSLGCVTYECLTGEVPFPRDQDASRMYAQLSEKPPKVTHRRPELPPAIDAVVVRAMAKKPVDRYPSAGVVARAPPRVQAGEHGARRQPPAGDVDGTPHEERRLLAVTALRRLHEWCRRPAPA